jgi:hypothetical protein
MIRALQTKGVFAVYCNVFPKFILVGILGVEDQPDHPFIATLINCDNIDEKYKVIIPYIKLPAYNVKLTIIED